jgi:AcrR family transcriptional regulator
MVGIVTTEEFMWCIGAPPLTLLLRSPTLLTHRSLVSPRLSTAPPSRQRRKDARPQELLAAALTLFVEKGFAATRIEQVAALAGVSKGTLYLYYPSKEELFKAVVRENLSSRIAEAAALVAAAQGSVAELLCHVMGEWWRQVGLGTAGGISKIMMAEARNFPELARFYVDEVVQPTHRLLGGLIERGIQSGEFRPVPVADTVHVLIGPMMHMILYQHSFGACKLHGPTIDPPAVLAVQMDLILRGLLSSPSSKASVQ